MLFYIKWNSIKQHPNPAYKGYKVYSHYVYDKICLRNTIEEFEKKIKLMFSNFEKQSNIKNKNEGKNYKYNKTCNN